MIDEFTKKQSEIFEEFQAKFRNLYKEIEIAQDKLEESNIQLKAKIEEVESIKSSAKMLEKKADNKFSEANQLMEKAINTQSRAVEDEERISKLKAEYAKTDLSLSSQRDELVAREQAAIQFEKVIEMKERKLKFERRKIDKLIEDAQITNELKLEMQKEMDEQP